MLGILEGYQVLYDRGGIEEILAIAIKKNEVEKEYTYEEEAETWIQKSMVDFMKELELQSPLSSPSCFVLGTDIRASGWDRLVITYPGVTKPLPLVFQHFLDGGSGVDMV